MPSALPGTLRPVAVFLQHPDIREVAIAVSEIQPVTHDEEIIDMEACIGRVDLHLPPRLLVEEHARVHLHNTQIVPELLRDSSHGPTRVQDIIDHDHGFPAEIFVGKDLQSQTLLEPVSNVFSTTQKQVEKNPFSPSSLMHLADTFVIADEAILSVVRYEALSDREHSTYTQPVHDLEKAT